jgi:hypothetical protein
MTPLDQHEALLNQVIHSQAAEVLQTPDLRAKLATAINELIVHDFDSLIQILYRMDVSEIKLKAMLQQHASEDAAGIIADLILERQEQKIASRKLFKTAEDIPEDEKW